MKLSVIIPSYKEPLLFKTVQSILDHAWEEVEIIVVLDGDQQKLKDDKRIKIISHETRKGMRNSINDGLLAATGKYVMKTDAHCLFAKGFDTALKKDFQKDWLVIPRRYFLTDNWKRRYPACDYEYLSFPLYNGCFEIKKWRERHEERKKYEIDDTMSFQGSCWFADREYFMKRVGLLDDKNYGAFTHESLEIGLKYWLGGGAVKINKKTWYAHLSKKLRHYGTGLYDRSYKEADDIERGIAWSTNHWSKNEEPNMLHLFSWLVEKFWPVPTWPADWKEQMGWGK